VALVSPLNVTTLENAIYTWFVNATGLTTIWADQSSPEVAYPYGLLKLIVGPKIVSPHWDTRDTTDLLRPAGTEVKLDRVNTASLTLSCQCLADTFSIAMNYMIKAEASLSLDDYLSYLRVGSVVVNSVGAIENPTKVMADKSVGQANMDVFITVPMEAIEYIGYIKTTAVSSASPEVMTNKLFGDI
jgi:hypothetical protein